MNNLRRRRALRWMVAAVVSATAILALYLFGGEGPRDMSDNPLVVAPDKDSMRDLADAEKAANATGGLRSAPDDGLTADNAYGASAAKAPRHAALYEKYRKDAESGDLDAALVLAMVFEDCRHVAQSEEEFRVAATSSNLSDEQRRHAWVRFETCEDLRQIEPDLHTEHERWRAVVRDSGHPLLAVRQRNLAYDQLRQRVLIALESTYPEEFLMEGAYAAAARLHLDYPGPAQDLSRSRAWELLACDVNIRCDAAELVALMRKQLPRWQFDEILDIADKLRESLRHRDYGALGF